jgi:hypothetical protein
LLHRSAIKVKERINPAIKAHLIRSAFYLLLLLALCVIPFALGQRQTLARFFKDNPTLVCNDGWQTGPDMPSTGVRMVGIFFSPKRAVYDEKFYAMGGRSMDGVGNDFAHPFEYDPASNAWSIKSAIYPDNQVSDMACGVLYDSGTPYIYCVGGSAGGQTTATDRVFRYDPITDTIESIASPWPGDSDGITLPGGFAVFNNKLYILGGFRINTAVTDTIWEFTPGTNTWIQKIATLPVPRGYIPTAVDLNGSFIYTAGGSDWNGTTLVDTNDSFRYDPVADSITAIPNIPRATAETRALMGDFGESCEGIVMWVLGGGETPPNPSNEVDIDCNGWVTGVPFLTARRNFPTDTDNQGSFVTSRIWLAGGYASDGTPLSSMEIFCHSVPTPSEPPEITPMQTPTPTPTPTVTPRATPRARPTPQPRPTPPPRP